MSTANTHSSAATDLMYLLPPPQSPLQVTEILALIFSNLDGPDLIRVSLVCAEWRDTVDFCRDSISFAFKFPKQFSTESSSHFDEPCKAYRDQEVKYFSDRRKLEDAGDVTRESLQRIRPPIVILGSEYGFQGKPVLEAMRMADTHLSKIKDGDKWWNNRSAKRHYDKLHYIRATFRGVRLGGSGWPTGLREIYCEICERFHTRFQFRHLHPVLRFLEDVNICVRGQGTILRLQLDLFNEAAAPRSCYEHYCKEIIEFAEKLRVAMQMIGPGGCGREFFSSPITTKIVAAGYRVIEDGKGLTLATVVPYLVERFHHHVTENRNKIHKCIQENHSWYHRPLMASTSAYPHVRAAYNDSEEAYIAHKQRFPEIVEMVDQAVVTVDKFMSGVDMWQSISAAEPDLERYYINASDMIRVDGTDTENSE